VTREELVANLTYLIEKYVESSSKKNQLLEEISRRDFYVARGVLHELAQTSLSIERNDAALFKDIAFCFA
jgi:hypothetical protein